MPVTVGGRPVPAVIVTFCGEVKLNPLARAYSQPFQRLLAVLMPLQSSRVVLFAEQ